MDITQNYREYRVAYETVYLNEAAAIHRQWNRRKGGINFVMVGHTDPSNSDNLNDDGLWAGVCECACVCVRACVHA